ncbi:MAG: GNAT family N-acetyltransferase, partial [Anaerolineales bacterium]
VANLIELCFSDTLNQEGLRYIQQMRQAAKNPPLFGFSWLDNQRTALPYLGFVWEEGHQIIGNLTIIPHHSKGGTHYLIANVAVHPEYRRRGIARLLTERAILYLHQKGVQEVWLHVRDDNPAAINLYQQLGFQENMRRTSWEWNHQPSPSLKEDRSAQTNQLKLNECTIQTRKSRDWQQHLRWINATYPPQFGWHLNFATECFYPGIKGFFYSSWYDLELRHWSLYQKGQLIGVVSVEFSSSNSRNIYLALDEKFEDQAAFTLISFLFDKFAHQKSWYVDYPAYRAQRPLEILGFQATQTLIWMSRPT